MPLGRGGAQEPHSSGVVITKLVVRQTIPRPRRCRLGCRSAPGGPEGTGLSMPARHRSRPCCLLQTDLVSAGTLPAVRMRLSAPMCLSVPPAPGITLWWGLLAENVLQNLIYCVSQDSHESCVGRGALPATMTTAACRPQAVVPSVGVVMADLRPHARPRFA